MKKTALLLALSATLPISAFAQVYTDPVGFIKFSIPGGSVASPAAVNFSLSLRDVSESTFVGQSAGVITGVDSAYVDNANAGWQPGLLSNVSSPYFVEILSGNGKGNIYVISSSTPNTAARITLNTQGDNLASIGIAAGDRYRIHPADTLSSLFGTDVLGGANEQSADNVQIHDGTAWRVFYLNTSVNPAQWRQGNVPVNLNNFVVRPDAGLIFRRRGSTPLEILVTGEVPMVSAKVKVANAGASFVGNVFPVDQKLSALSFQGQPNWVSKTADNNIADADKLNVWDGVSWQSYHYDAVNSQWRIGNVPVNRNDTVISAGNPFWIQKAAAGSGTATFTLNRPYNL